MNALAVVVLVVTILTTLPTRRHPGSAGGLGMLGDTGAFQVPWEFLILLASAALGVAVRVVRKRRAAATNAK